MKLTPETIQKTRQWFADNALACIAAVDSGRDKVNDPAKHRAWRMQAHDDFLAGNYDHSFSFQQRADYIQTGECVALLPKVSP